MHVIMISTEVRARFPDGLMVNVLSLHSLTAATRSFRIPHTLTPSCGGSTRNASDSTQGKHCTISNSYVLPKLLIRIILDKVSVLLGKLFRTLRIHSYMISALHNNSCWVIGTWKQCGLQTKSTLVMVSCFWGPTPNHSLTTVVITTTSAAFKATAKPQIKEGSAPLVALSRVAAGYE